MLLQEWDIYRPELCGGYCDWTQLEPTFTFSSVPTCSTQPAKAEPSEADEKPRQVSAYSMYFREHLPVMKARYPNANFGDYSRLVAAGWESLCRQKKTAYQQKAQKFRKELIRSAAVKAVRKIADREPLKTINNTH